MPRCLSFLLVTALLAALPLLPAQGAPVVLVRGEAVVLLGAVSSLGGRTTIEGELRDAALGRGLPRRRVRLVLDLRGQRTERALRTSDDGRFRFDLPVPADVYLLSLHFDGDGLYGATTLPPRLVDVSKPTVALQVDLPPHLDVSLRVQRLSLQARAAGRHVSVPILLFAGKRLLARLQSRDDGPLRIALATAALGRPGPLLLTFRFPGNATYNASTLQLDTVLFAPVHVQVALRQARVPADGRIFVDGTIRDALGPIAQGTVALNAMGRHAASVLSTPQGRFHFEIPASDYPPGALDLTAEFTPAVLWRRAARSRAVSVEILAPRPIPFRRYAMPAVATALTIGLLLGWRLRRRFRWLRGDGGAAKAGRAPGSEVPAPLASGLRTGAARTLRQRDFGISGTVWDPVDARPLAGARIRIEPAGPASALLSDVTGAFALEDLAAGDHLVRVAYPGYVSEAFTVVIPHRGALRGLRVDLIPVRVRILEVYREATVSLLPKPQQWARWTPRDLLRHLRLARRDDRALSALSRLLERAYWSPRRSDEGDLEQARQLARVLQRVLPS